jgi:hypothetical protein
MIFLIKHVTKLLLVEKHVTKSSHNHYILHTHDMCSCYLSEMDSCCSIEVQCQVIDSGLHTECTRKLHSALVKWLSKM